jgi:hypothetical protein
MKWREHNSTSQTNRLDRRPNTYLDRTFQQPASLQKDEHQLDTNSTSSNLVTLTLLLIAIILVAVSFMLAFTQPTHAYLTPENSILSPCLLTKYCPYVSSYQKLAHRVLLILTGAIFFILCKFHQKNILRDLKLSVDQNKKIWTVLAVILSVFVYIFAIAAGLQLKLDFSDWLVQASLLFILGFLRAKLISPISLMLAVMAILASWLPGIFSPPDLSNWGIGSIIEFGFHWSFLVAPADLLGKGRLIFEQVHVPYGSLLPVILGGWQLHFGALTIGQLIQINRILNCIFLSCFFWLYYRYAHRQAIPAAMSLAMILPLFYYNCDGICVPNQSAWRFLAFPLAFACLFVNRKLSSRWLAAITGVTSGLSLLYNAETGIAICISFVFYNYLLWLDKPKGISPSKLTLTYASGLIAALFLFVIITYFWLGQVIDLHKFTQAYSYLHLILSTSYTGLPIEFAPTAIIMLVHSAFVILATPLYKQLGFRSRFRATVAMCLLVWFAYWFNRPGSGNLMMMYPLYGFLLADLFRGFQRSIHNKSIMSALMLGVTLSVIVFTDCRKSWANEWPKYTAFSSQRGSQKVLVSGVYFSKTIADCLIHRSKFITELDDQSSVFLSPAQYYITKITGKYPPITFADPFECAVTKTDVDKLLSQIISSRKETIYIDNGFELTAVDNWWLPFYQPCANYYKALRKFLSPYYQYDRTDSSGWEIWHLRK